MSRSSSPDRRKIWGGGKKGSVEDRKRHQPPTCAWSKQLNDAGRKLAGGGGDDGGEAALRCTPLRTRELPHLATPGGLRLVSRQTPPAGRLQSRVLLPHVGRERNVPPGCPRVSNLFPPRMKAACAGKGGRLRSPPSPPLPGATLPFSATPSPNSKRPSRNFSPDGAHRERRAPLPPQVSLAPRGAPGTQSEGGREGGRAFQGRGRGWSSARARPPNSGFKV